MLYNAPTGSTDPNASFVGKNVSAGVQGSRVPPLAIEATQREIVAAIVAAGLSPTNTDLTQLTQAIRILAAAVAQTVGGAANGRVNLTIGNSGGAPNTTLNVAAEEVVVRNSAGQTERLIGFSATINNTLAGAGGIDSGTAAASTAYDLYAAYNPTTLATTAFATVEGAPPTLPSGFTFYKRIGWQRLDASKYWYRILQVNDRWQYVVQPSGSANTTGMQLLTNGTVGSVSTPTLAAVSLAGLAPVKSISVECVFTGSSSTNNLVLLAPNPNYGPAQYGSNPAYSGESAYGGNTRQSVLLETASTLYVASQANGSLFLSGGQINL